MHDESLTPPAVLARRGGPGDLAAALAASRRDTLATFAVYEQALRGLQVPLRGDLNPPLWELGHIGWFQEFWCARNPQRRRGIDADPDAARPDGVRPGADALYDSSRVPHDRRWSLPLPDAAATRADLARQLDATLGLLQADAADGDAALYFYRLALLHEDMHHEAALYMAQGLGIAIDDPRWQPPRLPQPPAPLAFDAGTWRLGGATDGGFVFDNEVPPRTVPLPACTVDAQVVRWAEFLPFVEAGGYADERCWSPAGRAWRDAAQATAPRVLRRAAAGWERLRYGRWMALDPAEPACHLSLYEADAWCRWAGRRLPTEGEWERAASTRPEAFRWGDVWEWTASPFAPHPGFVPHPYRDYSAPWFDGRPVLRGASFMTQPRMRHPCYRNYFPAGRADVPAGFRSCATGLSGSG